MIGDNLQQGVGRLRAFVGRFSELLDQRLEQAQTLFQGTALLADLVRHDDWLPPEYAQPHPIHYQQYLLHCDSSERFCVVSFVWGPGQRTPIHDHRTWGLIGMLRGVELAQRYALVDGRLTDNGPVQRLILGQVETLQPAAGDIHQVSNGLDDEVSISIHVYGKDIGAVRRSVFQPNGTVKPFVSGYANRTLPNIWGTQDR